MQHDSSDVISVQIDETTFLEANKLGEETYEIFKNTEGHYPNKKKSHILGKIGEMACAKWLADQAVECSENFKDHEKIQQADIVIGGEPELRIDVKSWNEVHWENLGRCVSVYQFGSIKEKSDAIVWCTAQEKIEVNMRVDIMGWSTIEDIENSPQRMTGPPRGRKVYNYQVDTQKIRTLSKLVDSLPK